MQLVIHATLTVVAMLVGASLVLAVNDPRFYSRRRRR